VGKSLHVLTNIAKPCSKGLKSTDRDLGTGRPLGGAAQYDLQLRMFEFIETKQFVAQGMF